MAEQKCEYQNMTVSVGVVALNEEKMLPALLDCIKQQTYPHDKVEVTLSKYKTYKFAE